MNNAAMKQSSSVAKIQTKICTDNHGFERQIFPQLLFEKK